MCQYIDPKNAPKMFGNDTKSFAYLTSGNKTYPLTTGFLPAMAPHKDSQNVTDGLTYTFSSETVCPFKKNETFGFQNSVICAKNVTGAASIVSVTDQNTCLPKVQMAHESGCSEVDLNGIVKFFDDNAWLSGTCLIVFGVIFALFGKAFFRWSMTVFAGFMAFMAVLYFASLFGWLASVVAIVLVVIVAIAAGLASGAAMYYFIPVAMVVLGLGAGLFAGAALFSLIVGISGYDSIWLMITLIIVGMLASGYLAWVYNVAYLSFATALVGGYMFMRGWTFFFPGYPSEMEMIQYMQNGEDIEFGWAFWVYFAVFICSSIFGYMF